MTTEAKPAAPKKEWDLEPESEYRFELDPGTTLAIKLLRGHAEIFGSELAEGKQYLFGSECKAAVFTWRGCTIEMSPLPSLPDPLAKAYLDAKENTSQANHRLNMYPMRHQ
ncbi:hypothetical protein H2248_009194 [Termitomyces sp. 'cryptogamus']|nr:hypothetical protein H2248_009194 [Termitomyces sp. 'cryptogamus']